MWNIQFILLFCCSFIKSQLTILSLYLKSITSDVKKKQLSDPNLDGKVKWTRLLESALSFLNKNAKSFGVTPILYDAYMSGLLFRLILLYIGPKSDTIHKLISTILEDVRMVKTSSHPTAWMFNSKDSRCKSIINNYSSVCQIFLKMNGLSLHDPLTKLFNLYASNPAYFSKGRTDSPQFIDPNNSGGILSNNKFILENKHDIEVKANSPNLSLLGPETRVLGALSAYYDVKSDSLIISQRTI